MSKNDFIQKISRRDTIIDNCQFNLPRREFIFGGISMEPQYVQNFTVDDMAVDRFGYLKPSAILYYAQEVAGAH